MFKPLITNDYKALPLGEGLFLCSFAFCVLRQGGRAGIAGCSNRSIT